MKASVRVLAILSLFALTSSAVSTPSQSLEGCNLQFCRTCMWIDQTCCPTEEGGCECCIP